MKGDDPDTVRAELSSSDTDSRPSRERTPKGGEKPHDKKEKKEKRRSRSAPSRRRRKGKAFRIWEQNVAPTESRRKEKEEDERQRSLSVGGEGSSSKPDAQGWVSAWQSAEEWNQWHRQYAANLMFQNVAHPSHTPGVSPPVSKYGGQKGGKKGEKSGGKEQKTSAGKNLQKNVGSALEMWRIMENAQIRGPARDIEGYFGIEVTNLAKRGKAFLEEVTRIQSFKKAKSAMRSFERLHGGSGIGIFAREKEMYDATLEMYKQAWGEAERDEDKWPDE